MKDEMNKEMDLLLRRLSRRQDGSMSNGDASIVGEHLDADELSSYAENALPAAARARYTEHLAECSGCRELIVQLSSSLGVVASERTAKAPSPSGLRNFLASLFSPIVLRYAIPSLGLIVVAAIGFFSLRQERGDLMTQQTQAPAVASNSNVHLNSYDPGQTATLRNDGNEASTPAKTGSADQAKPSHDLIAPPPNAAPIVDLRAEVKKDANATKADEQTAANVANAPQPTPAGPAKTDESGKTEKFEAEAPKEVSQLAVMESSKQPTASGFEIDKKAKDSQNRGYTGAGSRAERTKNEERSTRDRVVSPASGAVTGQAQTARGQTDSAAQSDDAETRSVAGRRFRKQGNLWIDTGFSSGSNTVNLTRGSEQYRALVADEPSIKTIADQLGGEIIVVWKGRAYRIR